MAKPVLNNAMCQCSFGTTPSALGVLPTSMVKVEGQPAATILDHKPMVNIKPFGMCQTPSNPQVAAATAAALGVLTPQPCIPATMVPWAPGSPGVIAKGMPALSDSSRCMCNWGGVISITNPMAVKTNVS